MRSSFIALAPMEGVTDFPVRVWFWLASAPEAMSTPFLRVTATYPTKLLPATYLPELNHPESFAYQLIPQLMAADVGHFLRAAEQVLEVSPFVDLNCGCPAPTVVGHGAGSSILKEPDYFHDTITKMVAHLGAGKLSVKMRTGFADDQMFPQLCSSLADLELHHVTIHGRTRAQRYLGQADWGLIDLASQILKVPVVGSGDINSLSCFSQRQQRATKVQRYFIGRGALRNPWIFGLMRGDWRQVSLTADGLLYVLAVLALLLERFFTEPERLVEEVGPLLPRGCLGVDTWQWQTFFEQMRAVFGVRQGVASDLELSRRTLGRIKMHWSYLRSSLGGEFLDPALLRARSWHDFCEQLQRVSCAYEQRSGSRQVALRYDATLDWIYAGGKQ